MYSTKAFDSFFHEVQGGAEPAHSFQIGIHYIQKQEKLK